MKCLNAKCGKEVPQTKGKREKQYCNSTCRGANNYAKKAAERSGANVNQPISPRHIIGLGYTCSVGNQKIIVIAVSAEHCMKQLAIMASGNKYQIESSPAMFVCHSNINY